MDFHPSEFRALADLPFDLLKRKFSGAEDEAARIFDVESKKTLLHVAAERGESEKLEWLLDNGADIHAQDSMLRTALHHGALACSGRCVETLLSRGADPNRPNKYKAYPIHYAAGSGDRRIVMLLLEFGADVRVVDRNSSTPLHSAAVTCSPGPIAPLCERMSGGEREARDRDGCTALHVAARLGSKATPVVAELLRFGCDPDAVDGQGRTPLYRAAAAKGSGSVYRLVEAGAVSKDAPTTFVLAQHYPEIISKILDAHVKAERLADIPMAPLEKIKFNYSCFLEDADLVKDPADKSMPGFYCILRGVAQSEHRAALAHPLVKSFLFNKWGAARKFVYVNICFTLLTHLTLTFVAFATKGSLNRTQGVTTTLDGGVIIEDIFTTAGHWLPHLALTCISILAIRETVSLFTKSSEYFRAAKNYLDIAWLVSGSIITADAWMSHTLLTTWSHQVAAMTVVLGSFETMLALGSCWPTLGEYVTIFVVVLKNFVVYSAAYLSLIVGFGLGFHVLFPWREGFRHAWTSVARALVMMSGELEFNSAFFETNESQNGGDPTAMGDQAAMAFLGPLSMAVFLLFVIIMSVVLMNLLIGLTVSDIQALSYQAQSSRLVVLLDTLIETHTFVQLWQNKCCCFHGGSGGVSKQLGQKIGDLETSQNGIMKQRSYESTLDASPKGRKRLNGMWLQLLDECIKLVETKEAREAESATLRNSMERTNSSEQDQEGFNENRRIKTSNPNPESLSVVSNMNSINFEAHAEEFRNFACTTNQTLSELKTAIEGLKKGSIQASPSTDGHSSKKEESDNGGELNLTNPDAFPRVAFSRQKSLTF